MKATLDDFMMTRMIRPGFIWETTGVEIHSRNLFE